MWERARQGWKGRLRRQEPLWICGEGTGQPVTWSACANYGLVDMYVNIKERKKKVQDMSGRTRS